MSQRRLNSSIYSASSCPRWLSARGWTLQHHAQWKYKEVWPQWHLFGDLFDVWVLSTKDKGCALTAPLMETSARQQALTLFFCLHLSIYHVSQVFPERQRWAEQREHVKPEDSLSVWKCIRRGKIIWLVLTELLLCLSVTWAAVRLTIHVNLFPLFAQPQNNADTPSGRKK